MLVHLHYLFAMQNDEFHENMSSLVEWLEKTETTIKESEPVDLTDPTPIIQAKYKKFRVSLFLSIMLFDFNLQHINQTNIL